MKILVTFLLFNVLWVSLLAKADGQVVEFDLSNGVHVIVNPVDEATDVGVETFYEVGFMDEPKGMVQSSHLLEHLVSYAPGAGFEAKEAMNWLNQVGMANAETMPDFTHYDYSAPATDLEKIFEIEAARLTQTRFDKDMIAYEAKRVYSETDAVERVPRAGMVKHAFMALAHAWKFKSNEALVRGGLEDMAPEKLHEFYKSTYGPQNLTVAVTGKADADQVKELAQKHLGNIPSTNPKPDFDWKLAPKRQDILWDSKHRSVCVAWNPPAQKTDQVLISLLGAVVAQKMMMDKELTNEMNVEMISCTNNMWAAGDLPVYVYAMAKPGADLDEIEKKLTAKFKDAMKNGASEQSQMVKSFAMQLEFQSRPKPWKQMQQMAQMISQQGRPADKAMQMVLTQDALQRGISNRLLGKKSAAVIETIKGVDDKDLTRLVKTTLNDANKHVVHIVPMN